MKETNTTENAPESPTVTAADAVVLPETNYSLIVQQMEGLWDYINTNHFNGQLNKRPLITIASRGAKRNALAWFWGNRWNHNDETGNAVNFNEINFSAETFARSRDEIYETMLHEMVHQLNYQKGVKDVNKVQYHNRKFKDAAELSGLVVTKNAKGYSMTALNDNSKDLAKAFTGELITTLSRPPRDNGTTKKMHSIPATLDNKTWFDAEAKKRKISMKEMLEKVTSFYQENAPAYEPEPVQAPAEPAVV